MNTENQNKDDEEIKGLMGNDPPQKTRKKKSCGCCNRAMTLAFITFGFVVLVLSQLIHDIVFGS